MENYLDTVILFSKKLVESRKRDNHNKSILSSKKNELLAKLVGEKMHLFNLNKIIIKINNYDKKSE